MVQAGRGVAMAGEWKDVALEDVADEITVGYVGPMASEYVENGVPFLRSLNVEPLRVNKNDLKFITPEFHHKIKKSRLTPDDVVIVRTGKPGACSVVPEWLYDANCSDLVVVRCGDQLDKRFLAFYVNTMATNHIAAHLVGAVQQHFNVGAARTMRIKLPPLGEQKRIAHILGTLDDKIELNRRMNATLEGMAQALFKSWFIDFDPVIDNILVKNMAKCSDQNQPSPPAPLPGVEGSRKSPRPLREDLGEGSIFDGIPEEFMGRAEIRRQALADGTANRDAAKSFPTAFQLTEEMGWIPEGWDEKRIEDCIRRFPVGKKYANKTAEENGAVPILDQGTSGLIGYHNDEPGVTASPDDPIIVFANHTCYMRLIMFDFSAIQNVLPFKGNELNIFWLYEATKGRQKFNEYKGHWPDFVLKRMVVPTKPLVSLFGKIVEVSYRKIYAKELEIQTLTNLRDTLLPKLISGELRIEDAEKAIGGEL